MNPEPNFNFELKIRPATQADIGAILQLWKILAEFHAHCDPIYELSINSMEIIEKRIKDQISTESNILLLAEDITQQKIVGYCKGGYSDYFPVFKMGKFGHISDLVVEPSYRNQQIGKKLYEEIYKWFLDKNITRIELGVATTNPISSNFWNKMGFQVFRQVLYKNIT